MDKELIEKYEELDKLSSIHLPFSVKSSREYMKLQSEISALKQTAKEVQPSEGVSFREFLTRKAIYTWSEIELIEKLYIEYASQLPKTKVTKKEIEELFNWSDSNIEGDITRNDCNKLAEWFKERQLLFSQLPKVTEITDEDIENAAPYKGMIGGEYLYKRIGWILGAKAMRAGAITHKK